MTQRPRTRLQANRTSRRLRTVEPPGPRTGYLAPGAGRPLGSGIKRDAAATPYRRRLSVGPEQIGDAPADLEPALPRA
jgi:hypothetical protein